MSLVSRLQAPAEHSASIMLAPDEALTGPPETVSAFIRRTFPAPAMTSRGRDKEGRSPRLEVSLAVLRRGAEALDEMEHRCRDLEGSLEQLTQESRRQKEAAEATIQEWQEMAVGLRRAYEEAQNHIVELRQRAEQAEAKAGSERLRADDAEARAENTEMVAKALQDEIQSAFGRFNGPGRSAPAVEATRLADVDVA